MPGSAAVATASVSVPRPSSELSPARTAKRTLHCRFALVGLFALILALLTACDMALPAPWPGNAILRDWVLRRGAWAPVAIILLEVGQVLLAPIPGQAIGLVSGYLFGVLAGTILGMMGTASGSLIAIWLTRRFGRPLAERLVPERTLKWLDQMASKRGVLFFLAVFLLPFLPDDMACFAAGLTPIPIPALMLVVLIGRLPGVWVACWLGAQSTQLSPAQWTVVIAASLGLVVAYLRYGHRLERWAAHLLD